MKIKLTYINHSNDTNNSDVVIFQKNEIPNYGKTPVAWKVIQNCGRGNSHPFIYTLEATVSARDSYGNYTPQLLATDGQAYHVTLNQSGHRLSYKGPASSVREIQIQNDLPQGAIDAMIYRSERIVAAATAIAPGQKVAFQFTPAIWIGAVSQITEGQVIHSEIISAINTEIPLLGIASADIVMSGGGPGPGSKPFSFDLDNVVRV